jgi:hypothetical protein
MAGKCEILLQAGKAPPNLAKFTMVSAATSPYSRPTTLTSLPAMLHDPSHRPQPITAAVIALKPAEKDVLRRLVAELSQIAALPV